MTNEEFNKIVDNITNKVKSTLIKKQNEYNLDEDRLSFFKKAAVLSEDTPHKTLSNYVNKHIISEFEMCSSKSKFAEDLWLEKIIDIICYQYLLYAVLKDTNQFKENKQ